MTSWRHSVNAGVRPVGCSAGGLISTSWSRFSHSGGSTALHGKAWPPARGSGTRKQPAKCPRTTPGAWNLCRKLHLAALNCREKHILPGPRHEKTLQTSPLWPVSCHSCASKFGYLNWRNHSSSQRLCPREAVFGACVSPGSQLRDDILNTSLKIF